MDALTDAGADADEGAGGGFPGRRIAAGADPVARVIAEVAGAFPADGEPGRTLRRLADALAEPLEVAVSGRRGVGRSAVAALLTDGPGAGEPTRDGPDRVGASHDGDRDEPADFRVVDLPAIDVPDHPDPDLDRDILVHVIGEGWHEVDLAAIRGRDPATTVVVIGPTVVDVQAARERWERSGPPGLSIHVFPAGTSADAVVAGRTAALERRYSRAIDEVDEAAITHRFARDRLEAMVQRIAVVRAAVR
ncbi:hypothetical protein [Millisia brevis]|uniref:hypothetical protein n=1 Tax=Millisia brevis TaxID=264148 RepID=UPI00083746EF|nr:hypothetical protein [Millisia brevis]